MKRVDPLIERDIEAGATLVVPSASRAAAVQLAYADLQLERGHRAWRTPDVVAYRAWLEREAYRAADAGEGVPRPLRAAEEWLLWREAAAAAAQAEGFEASERLPQALHRAARLMYDWDIAPAALDSSPRAESRVLSRALESVEARARALHAVGSHRLAGLLRRSRLPHGVTFAGFTEQSAARRGLMQAWSDGAGHCREQEPAAASSQPHTVRAADPAEELELAARWCRTCLGECRRTRLLIIVPDLAQRRSDALRIFRRVLSPQDFLSGTADEPASITLEGGTPLVEEPLVRHALTSLEFLLSRMEVTDMSAWLRTAFWGSPSAVECARLDAALREILDVDVTPAALLAALRGLSGSLLGPAQRLSTAVESALAALEPHARGVRASGTTLGDSHASSPSAALHVSALLGEWARRFDRALQALGWPGVRDLSAREQQSAARLAEVLEDLASIGGQLGPVTAVEALRTLRALADRRALAPPASDAAVVLSGALTDPVVRYDGIWIAGLHADAWPPPVELDPFIPLAAQRRAGIPSADASRRLAHAREVLHRCRAAAAHLVISWPARVDQCEQLPSPLLAEWVPFSSASARVAASPIVSASPSLAASPSVTASPPLDSLARTIRASRRLETFEDGRGEPWPARSPLPSGTRAIEQQSRCAFRAYAELRLACVPLAAPRPGVGALDRGRLLHRALELLWGQLGGSQGLEAASESGALARLIDECVERAADETLPVPREAASRAAQGRERRRAARLLAELADLERTRPPFRVRSTELRRSMVIEGAALDVRIDRIDELQDGSCAVFDYKTGRAAPVDWLAERTANPQLLVYALATEMPVAALAMIQLTPRRVAYRGMAERRDRLPKIGAPSDPAAWQKQIGHWRELVGRLAREFLQGIAVADPVADACATCHLHGFCRITEVEPDHRGRGRSRR